MEGNSDSGYSIFIDSENNIYIGGITYGTLNFGNSYASVGNGDAFIAKLNSSLEPGMDQRSGWFESRHRTSTS